MDLSQVTSTLINFITKINKSLINELGENCISIVLHGSLAMGCYYEPKSDLDLLVIIDHPLREDERKTLFKLLSILSSIRPTIGDIELSIVLKKHLNYHSVAIPYELHFSEELIEQKLLIDFKSEKYDSDLSAHLMVSFHRGIILYGKNLTELMNEPSWRFYRLAIYDDIHWILEGENILSTPFYSVLNLCRAYLLLVLNRDEVLSKEEGARIAIEYFKPFRELIQRCLATYQSNFAVRIDQRRTNGEQWDQIELLMFRDYCRSLFENSIS